jgi:hypothetical protein
MKIFLGFLATCLASTALMAQTALPGSAPEIDPNSAVTALGLLAGAGVIIRSRMKRK